MQNHYIQRALTTDELPDGSIYALLATNPDGEAIVFIHGFSGNATTTWSDFHGMILRDPCFAKKDVFFYGYNGLWGDMTASASLFRGFLDTLFSDTTELVNRHLRIEIAKRAPEFKYKKFLIIAHSLGAVLARRALLDATQQQKTWPHRTKTVLFAPAHLGGRVIRLALGAMSAFPFLSLFEAGMRFLSPLVDQLQEDSPQLKALLEDTERLRENGANAHLTARKVILAEVERVVNTGRFDGDPPGDSIQGTTHTSVCKPHNEFRKPLEHVMECLS